MPGASTSSVASSSPTTTAQPSIDTGGPAGEVVDHRVSFPFGVPAAPVVVQRAGESAITTLVGIYLGDHPGEDPSYQRISFYFRGGYPDYRIGYVPQVVMDGSGNPVTLDGNGFLSVVFQRAQAHDDAGRSTVVDAPPRLTGMSTLVSYAPAGDFEGHVSFGVGVRVPAGSDKTPPIRVGELARSDGSYVVYLDVRSD